MFEEKSREVNPKTGEEVPVWKSPKYMEARLKAESVISEGKYNVKETDFWIQKNLNKAGNKMIYTGLIISHNGCLRINDTLESKFDPNSVAVDKDGFGNSLVFSYQNQEQGIYEVGEVNKDNCKIAYPYAMALKRCFDRVVLKLSKIAYSGIYADTESDEFSDDEEERLANFERNQNAEKRITLENPICPICGNEVKSVKCKGGSTMSAEQIFNTYGMCANCAKESKNASN